MFFSIWLLGVLLCQLSAAQAKKRDPRSVSGLKEKEKVFREASQAAEVNRAKEIAICKKVGLNPQYGLGPLTADHHPTYDDVMAFTVFQEEAYRDQYENWWRARHWNYQNTGHFFDPIEPARMLYAIRGPNAVPEYYEDQRNIALAKNEADNEARILKIRNDAFLNRWERFGNLTIDGVRNFEKHQDQIRFVLGSLVGFLASVTFFYYFFKEGMPYVMKIIFSRKPQIVKEMRLSRRFWRSKKPVSRINELFYNEPVMEWLYLSLSKDRARVLHNVRAKGRWTPLLPGFLQGVVRFFSSKKSTFNFSTILLQGPPGTGKTALAKEYAAACDFDFIYVGGSSWSQLPEKDALINFNDTLRMALKNPRPVLFFVDEVEVVFPKRFRSRGVARKLTSAFLEQIDKPYHDKIKFVFATNMPDEVDPAVHSRISEAKKIGFPVEEQCKKIYDTYMDKFAQQHRIGFDKVKLPLGGLTGRDIETFCLDIVEEAKLIGQMSVSGSDIVKRFEERKSEFLEKNKSFVDQLSIQGQVSTDKPIVRKFPNSYVSWVLIGLLVLFLFLSILIYYRKKY